MWDEHTYDHRGLKKICEHEWGEESLTKMEFQNNLGNNGSLDFSGQVKESKASSQGQFCQICSAWRGSLGLEPTPELFISHIVQIFREVRRVLRKDGVCWVNLGSSYASGGMNPSRSPGASRDPSCGNDDKEQSNLKGNGHACPHFDDERQDDCQGPHNPNSHNAQQNQQSSSHSEQKGRDNVNPGLTASHSLSFDAQESKKLSSSGESSLNASSHNPGEPSPSLSHSFSDDVPQCDHKTYDTSDGLILDSLTNGYSNVKYKPKDLINIPHLVSEALRQDGWYLRSMMPWVKRSSMPESCTDRPASALEYVFLLTKSASYYFDMEAIRIKQKDAHLASENYGRLSENNKFSSKEGNRSVEYGTNWQPKKREYNPSGRNFRNTDLFYQSIEPPHGLISTEDELVGLDVNPQALKAAHFASFPFKLVEPLIKAGTSEKGCCPECGAPWVRVVEKGEKVVPHERLNTQPMEQREIRDKGWNCEKSFSSGTTYESKTIGWEPSCDCHYEERYACLQCNSLNSQIIWPCPECKGKRYFPPSPIPCTILDPFGGSGTVALVAHKLRRHAILIELSREYSEMAKTRLEEATRQGMLF